MSGSAGSGAVDRLTTFFRERMEQRGQGGFTVEGVLASITVVSALVAVGASSAQLLQELDVIPGAEFNTLEVGVREQVSDGARTEVVTVASESDPKVVRVFSAPPGLEAITVRAPKAKTKATGCVEVTGQTAEGKTVPVGTYVGRRSESWAPVPTADACEVDHRAPTVSRDFGR